MLRDKLYLVGFMYAGKTTVAEPLAKFLKFATGNDWIEVDLDRDIQTHTYLTVEEIFNRRGEEAFRDMEHEALVSYANLTNRVISVGGGTFTFERNQKLMLENGTVVYLDVPFESLLERYHRDPDKGRRPLFKDPENARELYERRLPLYEKAHIRVDGTKASMDVVGEIISKLELAKVLT